MAPPSLDLDLLATTLAVARLDPAAELPAWALNSSFLSLTRTAAELSVVCDAALVPAEVRCERGFAGLIVRGPLDFALTGILDAIAAPLARAAIPIFAISTFDTDVVLVPLAELERATEVLRAAGHRVHAFPQPG